MTPPFRLRTALGAATLCAMASLQAAEMSRDDYRAAKARIGAEYKAAKAGCDKLSGNAKDVCQTEAKGREKVGHAELEFNRSGEPAHAAKVKKVKADAAYDLAKERCDERTGKDKALCLNEAKAARAKALADAKADEVSGEARRKAAEDKREVDRDLAREKCDVLTGDSKANCLSAAKAKHGKG